MTVPVLNAVKRYNVRMPVKNFSLSLNTRGNADIHDITDQIANAIAKSGLTSGTATVFCPSATSALTTIEYEGGALSDLRRLFDEIVPTNRAYAHNERCRIPPMIGSRRMGIISLTSRWGKCAIRWWPKTSFRRLFWRP